MSIADAPTGVVTFLFTDIEGSTRRWESDAAEMRAALAAHDDVLRTAIEAHGGWLFKHTGDGVCAAFGSPHAAVDAAVAAQRALGLPVRMGIATGEAELRGEDYFGVALNRAARVMAAGHGGQILLADSTASLISGVELVDLGPRRLRDLTNTVGLFQVWAEGLGQEFPPLRTLDPTPGNLRRQMTQLIGRQDELAEVGESVRIHGLVTLTGVGGVGKTSLALEVATRLADEFPDGVWLFTLAAVTDPAAVPDSVAAVLGITQQPGTTLTDCVAAALDGRIRLLVFDNCEHVLDAVASLVETIFAHSSTVKVLATSREGLGLPDEQLWPVTPLGVASGPASAAVRLFVERAQRVAPHYSVDTSDEATTAQEICARLDGIPLAIELAASRMASMSAVEVRNRLDHRFRLLVGSRRGLERHQTLRHAVAWSYDLLDEAEQSLLDRCSVFAGGFDLESACAVAESDDEYAILDLLDALLRKSLLVVDRSSQRTRYSMLETIRQFAEEQLIDSGEATAVRATHAHYFAGREADILALWDSSRQREAYEWLTVEFGNLRTAFRWAADHAALDDAAAIATYAAVVGYAIDNYETTSWAEELIAPARAVDHPRLAFLYSMAAQCWRPGRIEDALRYAEAGQLVFARGDGDLPFGMHGWLPAVYHATGQPERAVEWARTQLARGLDTHGLTRVGFVFALYNSGSPDEAMAATVGLIDTAEATGNPHALSFALLADGFAFRDTDPGRALESLGRGLAIAQSSGNRSNESHLAGSLCRIEAVHGDPLTALDHVTLAIRTYLDAGNSTTIRVPLAVLAAFLDRLGLHEPAATVAGFASSPLTAAALKEFGTAIAHLRAELGDHEYEALARNGKNMTTTEIANYAYDQIDQARAALAAPP